MKILASNIWDKCEHKTNNYFLLIIIIQLLHNFVDLKGQLSHLHNQATLNPPDEDGDSPPDNYKYSRRRSRAVLYHLSGNFDRQKNAKSKLQLNKVGGLICC